MQFQLKVKQPCVAPGDYTLDSVAMDQQCAIEVTAMMEMFQKWQ